LASNIEDYVPYVLKSQARRNLQKIIALIPLDSDAFSFSVFMNWLVKHSPYDNAFEKGVDKRDAIHKMIEKSLRQSRMQVRLLWTRRGLLPKPHQHPTLRSWLWGLVSGMFLMLLGPPWR
jgi:hypothetical protein